MKEPERKEPEIKEPEIKEQKNPEAEEPEAENPEAEEPEAEELREITISHQYAKNLQMLLKQYHPQIELGEIPPLGSEAFKRYVKILQALLKQDQTQRRRSFISSKMIGAGITNKLRGTKLLPGHDRDGTEYPRILNFQPGYGELATIVAGLQKDVQRINQCLTLEGAEAYASKRKNWEAREEDITGPEGKPDGIKEVYVTDSKGNLKIINGWMLKKTEYPIRKAYRAKYPTKQARKENKYSNFVKEVKALRLDEDQEPAFVMNPADDIGAQYTNIQPRVSARTVYKEFIFRPVYETYADDFKRLEIPPMDRAQIFNKALSKCFDQHVVRLVLGDFLQMDPSKADQKAINKAMRRKDFQSECENRVLEIVRDPEVIDAAQVECEGMIDTEVNKVSPGYLQQAPPAA